MTSKQQISTNTDEKIIQVRWYEGQYGTFQCDFVTKNGMNSVRTTEKNCLGNLVNTHESNLSIIKKLYPQIIADVKSDPIDGWKLDARKFSK